MITPIVYLHRFDQNENQSSGITKIIQNHFPLFASVSLERGWKENKSNVSCIPPGKYTMAYEYSDKFKKFLWEIKGVKNRSECKFHAANYWNQLNSCVALGSNFQDINKDGYRDVTNSGNTMSAFEEILMPYKNKIVTLVITAEKGVY